MTDTTPMIAWLEQQHPEPAVIPADPSQRFVALLIEDFGDEWLWRPAMHYRWSYAADRELLSRQLTTELIRLPVPLALRRRSFARRQRRLFVAGDGVDARTRPHVEASYTRVLDLLEPILTARPFVLGERPTVADYGLYGSMFRHFSLDPTPARIMRTRAPAVFAWVARVWNARASRDGLGGRPLTDGVPADLEPLLREAGATHLPMLAANAAAFAAGRATPRLRRRGRHLPRRPDEPLSRLGARPAPPRLPRPRRRATRRDRPAARRDRLPGAAAAGRATRLRPRSRRPRPVQPRREDGPRLAD